MLSEEVVERLRERLPDLRVDHFPDAPDRFEWAKADRMLLVSYGGSNYSTERTMDPSSCERTPEIGVTILVRSLRGPAGAPAMIDRVRLAIHGWRPPSQGGRMYPTRDEFVSENQGVWRFVIRFTCSTLAVAHPDTPVEFPAPFQETDTVLTVGDAS